MRTSLVTGTSYRQQTTKAEKALLYLYVSIMKLWHLNHTPRKTAIITLQTQIKHPAKLLTNITNIMDYDPNENQLRYIYGVLKVALVY